MIFPHNDTEAIGRPIAEYSPTGQVFVVTESLFSMDGDIAPLRRHAAMCRVTGAALIIDEAHAVGLYGMRGSGLIEAMDLDPDLCISINSAGKALGVSGAFVAGPAWAIDYLIQRARTFIFSTAPPPAIAAALSASLDIVLSEPQRRDHLATQVARLRASLAAAGVPIPDEASHIIPIMIGDNARALDAAGALQAQGFDVRAIRPPSVAPGSARLRISVNAGLDDKTLVRFAVALAGVLKDIPSWSAASS
jgi:8-amino-7-oxononanoate synthase